MKLKSTKLDNTKEILTGQECCEYARLVHKTIKEPLYRLVMYTMLCTKLRVGEVLSLHIDDVDLESNKIIVRKQSQRKTVSVPKHLSSVLREYSDLRPKSRSKFFSRTELGKRISKAGFRSSIYMGYFTDNILLKWVPGGCCSTASLLARQWAPTPKYVDFISECNRGDNDEV